ncbi:MAG: polyprenyl synthetase family protein [Clostridia bacterium]|nr:polyprenyl synthetase family protein [Clostridia bacterium]
MRRAAALKTNEFLDKFLSCDGKAPYKKLYDSMNYSVSAGGKRIRPYLCAEFYSMLSGNADITPAIPYCAAVEMVHTSSLIHDDLPAMDNDVLRRGMPTNHVKFGEATAILAGDTLLLKACAAAATNKYMSHETNVKAVEMVTRKACGMMAGQQIDLISSTFSSTEADLIRLQSLKTGCLLSLSCMLGALAAGKSTDAAEDFGYVYGLLFQITDDLLDSQPNSETGKTGGKDERDHKATFVTLLGREKAEKKADELLKGALATLNRFPDGESRKRLYELCEQTRYRKK